MRVIVSEPVPRTLAPISGMRVNGRMADRGDEAWARGQAAGARAMDLRERLARLAAGKPATVDDLRAARSQAKEAAVRAAIAGERAVRAHQFAARAHERAALLGDSTGHSDLAEQHRRAAEADRSGAIEDGDWKTAEDLTPEDLTPED
jgi:hypothetical protein